MIGPKLVAPVAVYRFFAADGALLYVGMTVNPAQRWRTHGPDKGWWGKVADSSVEWHESNEAAATAERVAIRTERPAYNVTYGSAPCRTPRTGRPPIDNPRTNIVPIRLAADELAILKTAAGDGGTTTSDFIRTSALAAAALLAAAKRAAR